MAAEQLPAIVIQSEDDAWRVLARAVEGEFDDVEEVNLRFVGWPRFKIELDLDGPIITPSVMRGIIELQSAVYRSYVLTNYGTHNTNRLTRDEKEGLEFEIKVSEGRSISEILGEEAFIEFLKSVSSQMTPEAVVISVLGTALILAGSSVLKNYLQTRAEERREEVRTRSQREMLEHLQFTQQQETERMRLMARAMQTSPALPKIDDESEEAKRALLKNLPADAVANLAGTELEGKLARELVKNPRRRAEEIEFEREFSILRVDTTVPDGFRVRLQSIEGDMVLTAGVRDVMLSERERAVLREAEWTKAPVLAAISAKRRGEEIVEAVIVKAERLNPN